MALEVTCLMSILKLLLELFVQRWKDKTKPQWMCTGHINMILWDYPLVNVYVNMENHIFSWVNQLVLWQFSITNCLFTRDYLTICGTKFGNVSAAGCLGPGSEERNLGAQETAGAGAGCPVLRYGPDISDRIGRRHFMSKPPCEYWVWYV